MPAAGETGVLFTNRVSESRHLTNQVLLNGSGVCAGDVDGDGRVDLFFSALEGPCQLYRNLGNWRFEETGGRAGVSCPGLDATGAVFADVDGDGDLDLLVSSLSGGTRLFLNNGRGHFTPSPVCPILNEGKAGTSMALSDTEGNGTLDLYVANYRNALFFLDNPEARFNIRMTDGQPRVVAIDGRPLTEPDLTNRFLFTIRAMNGVANFMKEELGQPDSFYRNNGRGGFAPVSWTGGAFLDEEGRPLKHPPFDWGLSVVFRDLNGDGRPDLYVCNDFKTPDRFWINQGGGRFRAAPRLAVRQTCLSAMGADVADLNRDGHFDLFVEDMLSGLHSRRMQQRIDMHAETSPVGAIDDRPQVSRNVLQLARGDGTFAEIAQFAGLEAADWAWTPLFLDADLDGFEDLLISNGFERDTMNLDAMREIESRKAGRKLTLPERLELRKQYPRLATPNLAFRNLGNLKFADVSDAWGFNTPGISQGMCLADLDNDGDLDVVVNNFNAPAALYRNETAAPRLAVRLRGAKANTRGIGARIDVLGGPVPQSQEMVCGGRYLSSDDPMRTFATGGPDRALQIVVTWRSGAQTTITNARPNRLYEIDETAAVTAPPPEPAPAPFFKDASALLAHTHHETLFDDFARQPLLPFRLSQPGPGVSWFDLDGDGWEDLIIASGQGGRTAAFHNDGRGGFQRIQGAPFDAPVPRDQTTLLGWPRAQGGPLILGALSTYEDGPANALHVLDPAAGTALETLAGLPSSLGPMAMADLDGDRHLDLFLGGRVIPGRYPEAASSLIFRQVNGEWVPDATNNPALERIGLVTGAVFSDLDGDGAPDLVLACEWGPVRVFHNQNGRLSEITTNLGLDKFTGWWQGVTAGDFDGDGRMDIAASNWGANSKYQSGRPQPLLLYYGDFNGDGSCQLMEARHDPSAAAIVPLRRLDVTARVMPWLQERFPTFQSYGAATLSNILGERMQSASRLEASWLETTVFLNRGNHFDAVVLPMEAQLSPAFAVCAGDLDGDGLEDLFLSQNFFAVPAETSRYDAGRGLWLRGDGRGGFQPVSGAQSGLLIYGEQRGAALCDYDGDGRLDLCVAQNGAATVLYHNERARPGLRVRLQGQPGNPLAAGAVLRVLSAAGAASPAREIHAGSGYCSQESAVQILALPAGPARLQVRWPGGKTTLTDIPANARKITVTMAGMARAE